MFANFLNFSFLSC